VLHTDKVLLFAGSGNDELYTTGLRSAVWDYMNGEWMSPFTPVDFFCSGQSFLADGRVIVAGGTKEYDINGHGFIGLDSAYAFDPISEQWTRLQNMTVGGRWYPTLVALGDGRVFTVSGGSDHAEIYSSVTGWTQLPQQGGWPLYPHVFLRRNGHLFFTGGNVFANPPSISPGILDLGSNAFNNVGLPGGFDLGHRDHCASVMLPTAQDQKVMIMGGGSPAINEAHIIDLNVGVPAYAAAADAPRAIPRQCRAAARPFCASVRRKWHERRCTNRRARVRNLSSRHQYVVAGSEGTGGADVPLDRAVVT